MCGFVAIFNDPSVSDATVKTMCDAMEQRGPDFFGAFRDAHMIMGHRRLSIIDLSDNANQPMHIGNRVIVFNGEIYNYLELKEELEKRHGRYCRTKSDTEVIVQCFLQYGPACVSKFNGMFSFIIWDSDSRELFVARDRLGVKPLFYVEKNGAYYFASDPKALWTMFPPSASLDKAAFLNFFINKGIVGHAAIGGNMKRFPPAHWARIARNGEMKTERYWNLLDTPASSLNFDDAVSKTDALLTDAIKLRLRSDVPIGCFLSGGIDSTLIAAAVADTFGQKVNSYSVGFDEEEFDESVYSFQVARKFGLRHHHDRLTSGCLESLPKIIWDFSEPCGDESAVPMHFVSKWAAQGLKVVLTGDGADEAFGGYRHYFNAYLDSFYSTLFPHFLRKGLQSLLSGTSLNSALFRKIRKFNNMSLCDFSESFAEINNLLHFDSIAAPDFKKNGLDIISAFESQVHGRDAVEVMTYTDIQYYLIQKYLPKVDYATMAHSIEARSPFLDYRLFELGFSLNNNIKYRKCIRKAVLKKIVRRHFNRKFVYRKKGGFSPPMDFWLKRPEIARLVKNIIAKDSFLNELINKNEITRILDEYYGGKEPDFKKVWLLLWFQVWHGLFITGNYSKNDPLSGLPGCI